MAMIIKWGFKKKNLQKNSAGSFCFPLKTKRQRERRNQSKTYGEE